MCSLAGGNYVGTEKKEIEIAFVRVYSNDVFYLFFFSPSEFHHHFRRDNAPSIASFTKILFSDSIKKSLWSVWSFFVVVVWSLSRNPDWNTDCNRLFTLILLSKISPTDDINLKLQRNPGNVRRRKESPRNNFKNNNNFQSTPNTGEKDRAKDDLKFTKNETIDFDGARLYLLCGHIRELENGENGNNEKRRQKQQREEATQEEPARQQEEVCVIWNQVPERITLKRTASSISFKFVMAVDKEAADVRQEMMDGNVKFTWLIH
jgi:hypothetical protein